jgi:hypothetical protein
MSVFPVFVFERHREVENQDLILAGSMSPAEARHRAAMARRASLAVDDPRM